MANTTTNLCADGCGERTKGAKSRFLQGHDQRLIAALSDVVTTGRLSAKQRRALGLQSYDEQDDIQERINQVAAAIATKFSEGLARKFDSAAHRKWEQAGKQIVPDPSPVQRKSEPAKRSRAVRTRRAATK
ncbi:hypothetical protein ACFORO_26025 [Amycolatopsis halotolerans]|uniref:Uncharacterized protein n=1 Tax=Amycolatopsis halotolerans TaxID=330083 RepID=A0ABV7QNY7_9PSEU